MLTGIELEKALQILQDKAPHLQSEFVTLLDAHKRVLVEDVESPINQPPFNRSPLDGYAFKAEDSKGASKETPVELKVLDEVFAGHVTYKEVTSGTAIRIMTGAPIPKGANCVLRQEDTDFENGYVKILKSLSPWDNVCFQGEDLKSGELVLKKNTELNHGEIGILASMGFEKVKVYEKLRIAILSTGDEILNVGEKLAPGKIYNSNLYCLYARLKELNCEPIIVGISGDDNNSMEDKIKWAVSNSHMLITTGGVSVGKKDIVKDVMKNLDAELLFWKVAMKPGSPIFCSMLNQKLVISLSGNPAAAITSFELLVRPLILKTYNKPNFSLNKIEATLCNSFNKNSPQRRFVRGYISNIDGKNVVNLTQTKQGNGILSSIINSNCLIDIPAGSPHINEGQVVEVITL